ncbi:hypothetical protein CYY_006090 [Polysphondylium violaceum]|uniref:Myb-like domain-containing protein n=1 Tax=Polysphondylium violaceum TaxID=133409 RepID=A0A8J4PRW4_9MYCE|nr:hypothetical protein CYY_006090 [Polysphondylium violaceum]
MDNELLSLSNPVSLSHQLQQEDQQRQLQIVLQHQQQQQQQLQPHNYSVDRVLETRSLLSKSLVSPKFMKNLNIVNQALVYHYCLNIKKNSTLVLNIDDKQQQQQQQQQEQLQLQLQQKQPINHTLDQQVVKKENIEHTNSNDVEIINISDGNAFENINDIDVSIFDYIDGKDHSIVDLVDDKENSIIDLNTTGDDIQILSYKNNNSVLKSNSKNSNNNNNSRLIKKNTIIDNSYSNHNNKENFEPIVNILPIPKTPILKQESTLPMLPPRPTNIDLNQICILDKDNNYSKIVSEELNYFQQKGFEVQLLCPTTDPDHINTPPKKTINKKTTTKKNTITTTITTTIVTTNNTKKPLKDNNNMIPTTTISSRKRSAAKSLQVLIESESEDDKKSKRKKRSALDIDYLSPIKVSTTKTKVITPTKPSSTLNTNTNSNKENKENDNDIDTNDGDENDNWTTDEKIKLQQIYQKTSPHLLNFWNIVSDHVVTKTAQQCQKQYDSRFKTPVQKKTRVLSKKDSIPFSPIQFDKQKLKTLKSRKKIRNVLNQAIHTKSDKDIYETSPFKNQKNDIASNYINDNDDDDLDNDFDSSNSDSDSEIKNKKNNSRTKNISNNSLAKKKCDDHSNNNNHNKSMDQDNGDSDESFERFKPIDKNHWDGYLNKLSVQTKQRLKEQKVIKKNSNSNNKVGNNNNEKKSTKSFDRDEMKQEATIIQKISKQLSKKSDRINNPDEQDDFYFTDSEDNSD